MTQPVPRTLIIAEAGVNHDGRLDKALHLVDVAADAGADVVKFQTFAADRLVTRQAAKADYQIAGSGGGESQYDMIKRLELTRDMHESLIAHCEIRGIGFLSSGFDAESIHLLAELGAELFKIPSGELTNLPYLRHVGRYGKPIILSSGMATMEEIRAALDALEAAGTPRDRLTVLHCNTEYPTPMADVNLRAMVTIGEALGVKVGYSDHTLGFEIPIAAVALGATVIEKHFTLDRMSAGPDHAASLDPGDLRVMIAAIRNLEQAMGDGIKRPSPSEIRNMPIVRKSLVAARPIRAGEKFSEANVAVKRPGTGCSPMRWDEIIGREAPRDFAPDELIDV